MLTYLVEMTVYDPDIPGTKTLYFSTSGYTTSAGDIPASTHYESRIIQPGLMRRDIFSQGTTGGANTVGFGVLEIANDGDLDYLLDCGLDGRKLRVLIGDSEAAYSTFVPVLTGTMEQPEFTQTKISVRLRDRLAELDIPASRTLYLGNNSLPNGLEGDSTIKGKPKPLLFGRAYSINPPLVNESRLIYQVSSNGFSSILTVFDVGTQITAGSDYTSQSDMENNAPAAGTYRAWPAGGYIRLGSTPVGPVTLQAQHSVQALGSILSALAQLAPTVPSGDINSSDVAAVNTIDPLIGIYIPDSQTILAAMNEVANSRGVWFGFDRLGSLRMGQLAEPVATPVLSLTDADIITLEKVASGDKDRGVPAYQVKLNFFKRYYTQSMTNTAVSLSGRPFFEEVYNKISSTDSSVQTTHLLSPVIEKDTLIDSDVSAQAEADRLLNLLKVRRDRLNVTIMSNTNNYTADIGKVVKVTYPRFGYDSGKLFIIIGIQSDYRTGKIDLTLWG